MSFGGAVSAMTTSLKNNKRKRPSAYEKMEGYETDCNTQLNFDKKATPEQLKEIRERLRKDNLKAFIIKTIVLIILLSLFFYIIW